MKPTGYEPLIIEATGCSVEEAKQVEALIRSELASRRHIYGLDGLSREELAEQAFICFEALKILRAEDPAFTHANAF